MKSNEASRGTASSTTEPPQQGHSVVVVGGGFAGLSAVQALGRSTAVNVTLIDQRNHHVFQPLLYQVATGTLSPANVCSPLRTVLRRQKNVDVVMAQVVGFDPQRQLVLLSDGQLAYDTLIVAAGSQYNYFGKPWERIAPSLKSVEDAIEMRRRILSALEQAEREREGHRRQALLTFVIIGGGPTGVELAGALAEIARYCVGREFRHIQRKEVRIVLLEGQDRILSAFPQELSAKAARSLERLGVEVRTGCLAQSIDHENVEFLCGGQLSCSSARTVFWTAGVRGSPLAELLAKATGAELDNMGRIVVERDLTLPGHAEIFAIGDMAHFAHQNGQPLPGLAPVAMQQGKYVSRLIKQRLRRIDTQPMEFRYRDYGTMATVGRSAAVAMIGKLRFNGIMAWLAWLLVHLMQLVTYQNRVLVFIQWAWHYFTFSRSSQLITMESSSGNTRETISEE